MRSRLLRSGAIVAALLLAVVPSALGKGRDVQEAFKATNNTGKDKIDLDVIYSSDTNMTVSALTAGITPVTLEQPTYTITGNGTRTVTIRFDGDFPKGSRST